MKTHIQAPKAVTITIERPSPFKWQTSTYTISRTFKTARNAAKFYARQRAGAYFNDKLGLAYWPTPAYEQRVFNRILPIFKKILP